MSSATAPPNPVDVGVSYSDYKQYIEPLDIVLFRGGDLVSNSIRFFEKERLGNGCFSHSGIIVTRDVLFHPNMVPGKLYILESTVTGFLGCGVKNIDGKAQFCVQITDFDALVEAYQGKSADTAMAIVHLQRSPLSDGLAKTQRIVQDFWDTYKGRSYEFNFYTLLAALFPFLRPERRQINKLLGTSGWIFCSQLVCMLLQALGVYPDSVPSDNVLPVDFVVEGGDKLPLRVRLPPVYILNRYWAKKQQKAAKPRRAGFNSQCD